MDQRTIRPSLGAPLVVFFVAAALAGLSGSGCDEGHEAPGDAKNAKNAKDAANTSPATTSEVNEPPLDALYAFESERRAKAHFDTMPASDKRMGADPYEIQNLPKTANFISILRGQDAVVLLDEELHEIARAPAPRSPTGLAINAAGDIFVSGELSTSVARFRVRGRVIEPSGALDLGPRAVIRGLAAGPEPGVLYAADELDGRLITLVVGEPARGSTSIPFRRDDTKLCGSAVRVARVGSSVLVNCLVDHEIVVRRVDSSGAPTAEGEARLKHDGPLWCFDAIKTGADGGDLLIAAGGVEDQALDRTEGSFGFIDSFVYLYRLAKGSTAPARVALTNVSSVGVITPKVIRVSEGPAGVTVRASGYGGEKSATLFWAASTSTTGPYGEPEIKTRDSWPGATAMAERPGGARVYSNTLLDAWILERDGGPDAIVPADPLAPKSPEVAQSRLGEALFFTSLMAPWNKTDGRLSRFTCETCHFEGYVDGRTHHTGRGDVRATTKPLLGLFNNRPHFSRALDPNLSTVAHNEFRVAGANSGHDPMFSLTPEERPILSLLGLGAAGDAKQGGALGPAELRIALMAFLMDFTHRPNPLVVGRASFTEAERAGSLVFRSLCEGCHNARLSADEPASRLPEGRWEALVMSDEGPIVWASSDYKKTGVEPYVHERGARVPSLRRLYKKRPYFTDGSAKTLRDVLDRARVGAGEETFYHDRAPEGASVRPLDDREKAALLPFIELL